MSAGDPRPGTPAARVAAALRPLGYRVFVQSYRGEYGLVIEGPAVTGAASADHNHRVGTFYGVGEHAEDDVTARGPSEIIRVLTERAQQHAAR